MKRLLFLCTLLLALWPSTARAEPCTAPEEKTYTFTAADSGVLPGAIRGTGGSELLIELTTRVNARGGSEHSHLPRQVRSPAIPAGLRLSTRSAHVQLALERQLPCGESPFLVYLPYHANPPPFRP